MAELSQMVNSPAFQMAGVLGGGAADLWNAYNNVRSQMTQRNVGNTMSDPRKLAAFTGGLYQPLSDQALKMVNRGINANTALRGVSQGGYAGQFAADALARLETQRQEMAQRQAMSALGGTSNALPPYAPMNAMGNAMKQLAALQQLQRGPQMYGQRPALATMPGTGGGMPGGMFAPGFEGNMYAEDPTLSFLNGPRGVMGDFGAGQAWLDSVGGG